MDTFEAVRLLRSKDQLPVTSKTPSASTWSDGAGLRKIVRGFAALRAARWPSLID